MPWLGRAKADTSSTRQWTTFLRNALLRRLTAQQLAVPLDGLARKYPVPSADVAEVMISFRASKNGSDDPMWFRYAQMLLTSRHMTTADFLVVLLEYSHFSNRMENVRPVGQASGMPTCEERTFTMLAQLYSANTLQVKQQSVQNLVYVLTRWLHAVHEYETARQLNFSGIYTADVSSFGMYEALANLVLIVFRSNEVRAVAQLAWWKVRRPVVVQEMSNFDLHILQWMQSQLGMQLQALAKSLPFVETDADGRPKLTMQDILDSVVDVPNVRSRAGLYIWLNACLCGRPMTDDEAMQGYLQARYATDYQSMAVDLLVASFDVLTNAMLSREPRQSIKIIRSFICNKLPLWLALLAGFVATSGVSLEACIQLAFMSSITEDVLPPMTAGANDVREVLKQAKLEFLQACALHHLVTESTIAQILHEPSIALPRVTKYTRDGLVAQCTHNVGRLEGLVDELQGLQGNAGAVVGCIVQVITNLCVGKDTMSLKAVCHILIRRVPDMDIIFQHDRPSSLLLPLCQLLNEWVHDQDQTEFTPAYEEFAAVLMLVLAVTYRYDMDIAEVGLTIPDTFIERLVKQSATSHELAALTDEQGAQLGKWIDGLYTTDEQGETSGIGDDVMRQCPPQDFYLLVPTLLQQSVLACQSGHLPMSTFKTGLELLLEPFLLPSLVCGLRWLVRRLWGDHGDSGILLQVLEKLLRPSSKSQEMQAMYRAILAIVASPLVNALQDLQRRHPEMKEVGPLIALLKPYEKQQRTSGHSIMFARANLSSSDQLRHGMDLGNWVRQTVAWASSVEPTQPSKYSHNMLVSTMNVLGPELVLKGLVTELKDTLVGASAIAMDVCVSIICAPTPNCKPSTLTGPPSNRSNQVTLRDCLSTWASDTTKLLRSTAPEAEAIIRLSRKVELQSAIPQIQQIAVTVPAQDSTDQVLQDLGLTDVDVPGASVVNHSLPLDQTTTAGFSDGDIVSALDQAVNLTSSSTQDLGGIVTNNGAMQVDQEQNFFADLDLGMSIDGQPQQRSGMNLMGDSILADTDNGQSAQEDDIFAGLDMGNTGDDFLDFN